MKSRTTARGRARRDQLLDVALEAFAAKGYRGTSVGAIAERVGMSEPGLLHHFPTKVALLQATLEHHQTRSRVQAYAPGRRADAELPGAARAPRRRARGGLGVRAAAAGDRGREHRGETIRRTTGSSRATTRCGRPSNVNWRPTRARGCSRPTSTSQRSPACWSPCSTASSSSSCSAAGRWTSSRRCATARAVLRRAQLGDVELQRRRDVAGAAAREEVLQLEPVEGGDDRPRGQHRVDVLPDEPAPLVVRDPVREQLRACGRSARGTTRARGATAPGSRPRAR